MKRLLLPALVILVTACGTPTTIDTNLTGTWKTQIGDLVILVDLTQDGSALSGSVTFTEPSASRGGTATGSVKGADVSLTLASSSGGSVDYSGALQNEFTISGRATSTNFTPTISDAVAVLIKQ